MDLSVYPQVTFDFRFTHPASFYLSGASGVGKSTFLYKLLLRGEYVFKQAFRKIIIVYGIYQSVFDELKKYLPIKLVPLEDFSVPVLLRDIRDCFVIADDAFVDLTNSAEFTDLVTKASHHKGFSIAIVSQYAFGSGKFSRVIATNCQYTFLWDNCRDRLSIQKLAQQMFPHDVAFFMQCFHHATSEAYAPLLIDCNPGMPNAFRLRAHFFDLYTVAYFPLKDGA